MIKNKDGERKTERKRVSDGHSIREKERPQQLD